MNLPLIDDKIQNAEKKTSVLNGKTPETQFKPIEVDLSLLQKLSSRMSKLFTVGEGVEDYPSRSEAVFAVTLNMVSAAFSNLEIQTFLTDRTFFLGEVAYGHANSTSRKKAAEWIYKYCILKARKIVSENSNNLAKSDQKLNLTFTRFGDIELEKHRTALIEDLMYPETVVMVVAKSGIGKTFVVLYFLLSIARGEKVFGRKSMKGAVLYISLEGGAGINKRILATRVEHQLDFDDIPFYSARGSLDLLNQSQVNGLVEEIKKIEAESGPFLAIAIDTVAQSLAGGNENASDVMGAFNKNVQALQQSTGATIILVHHTGKDEDKGARGHSSLFAAVDTELTLKRIANGKIEIKVTKQKDGEEGAKFYCHLKEVDLGKDNSGKMIKSCVVVPTDEVFEIKEGPKLSTKTRAALEILENLVKKKRAKAVTLSDWRDAIKTKLYPDSAKQTITSTFSRAKEELSSLKIIKIEDQNVRLS